MTDELDDLRAALDAATPAPDAAKRAADIALARENFAALQGSRDATRHTPATEGSPLWTGVKTMLTKLTTKGGLTVTTAIIACGFLVLTPQGRDLINLPSGQPTVSELGETNTAPTPTEDDSGVTAFGGTIAEESDAIAVAPSPDAADLALDEGALVPPAITAEREEAPVEMLTQSPAAERGAQELGRLRAITEPAGEMADMAPAAPPRIAPGPQDADDARVAPDTEAFANAETNPLRITAETPVSTFSIDVDTASYAVLRSSLMRGQLPAPGAIRIEELINYFPYDYAVPEAGQAPFRPTVNVFETPWNADTQLVQIAIQGTMPALEDRPPLNLVFLIDTSGSMNDAAKLPLLKQSFRLMLDQLRPQDEVAIVAYAGSAGQVLAPTPASDRATILAALNALAAGGGTNGQGGLEQAYATAAAMARDGEVSRVILATDGDFNVGLSDPRGLEGYIADQRDSGTYLSVLGFGRGNLDDETMQALAQNGNGTAAYIDTLSEAQKVLVDNLTGALFPIANDVKIQVEFNPALVAEYRLIGYETRALRREDFNNDAVDAGELGAGHTVTAIYEITPVGSPAVLSDPLRYQPTPAADDSDELGFLRLRYKAPGDSDSQLIETPIATTSTDGEAQFAAAIAGFGQLLQGGTYLGDWTYADAIALANANRGDDPFGYRTEAVQLMRLAASLSGN
ncbi:von Willebrand factor type A domain-containing protein [Octadecabacter sp. R77987]|uniref:vWA domain-containing protein n=1 Tax=Octadecabacter sp. R77987 TaxID=3093874 RepID=UPI0036706696